MSVKIDLECLDFSTYMENKEKIIIKLKFGLCLQQIIEENKAAKNEKKLSGVEDHNSVTSLRKLAAASGIEFSIIQKVSSGKRNPELSTIVGIAEGLNITLGQLFSYYDKVTEEEIKAEGEKRKKRKKK